MQYRATRAALLVHRKCARPSRCYVTGRLFGIESHIASRGTRWPRCSRLIVLRPIWSTPARRPSARLTGGCSTAYRAGDGRSGGLSGGVTGPAATGGGRQRCGHGAMSQPTLSKRCPSFRTHQPPPPATSRPGTFPICRRAASGSLPSGAPAGSTGAHQSVGSWAAQTLPVPVQAPRVERQICGPVLDRPSAAGPAAHFASVGAAVSPGEDVLKEARRICYFEYRRYGSTNGCPLPLMSTCVIHWNDGTVPGRSCHLSRLPAVSMRCG